MIDFDRTDAATLEVAVVTGKGTLVITFFPDKAPAHVRNFLELAQSGFYDGTTFHRVIRNFMIQGGCPNTREGAEGAPGTGRPDRPALRAEFNDVEHRRGIVSMARGRDPNSAGSQFFVVHADHAAHLDGHYTAFGQVEEGLDVLDQIAAVECDFGPGGERSQPCERIEIERIELRPRTARAPEAGPAEAGPSGSGADEAAAGEAAAEE